MPLTYYLLLFILGLVIYYSVGKCKVKTFMARFSGPLMLPIIGNVWYIAKSEERLEKFLKLQRNHGNRVGLSAGGMKILALFHPDDVGMILNSKHMNKSPLYELMLTDWLGASLFYAKGKEYDERRKLYTPSFDFKKVDSYVQNFNKHAKALVSILREEKEKVTDIRWPLTLCTLDIITQYSIGTSVHSLSTYNQEYARAVHKEVMYVTTRWTSPLLWPELIWKWSSLGSKERETREVLHRFMDKMGLTSTADADCLPKVATDYNDKVKLRPLDLLIREQLRGRAGTTDKYIRDELNGFIFAGHDTVASSLTFTVFLLASNSEEQAKVHAELDTVFGEDRERDVDAFDLPRLKYLEWCIKEALRMYPPAPYMLRELEKEFKLDEETTIPAGVQILLSPWVTHRLPEFFPEPDQFRPSRFSPENCIGRNPYAFIPFSAGHRSCMGQKIALAMERTILAHLFRNFTVELESPDDNFQPSGGIIMFPKDGMRVKLHAR